MAREHRILRLLEQPKQQIMHQLSQQQQAAPDPHDGGNAIALVHGLNRLPLHAARARYSEPDRRNKRNQSKPHPSRVQSNVDDAEVFHIHVKGDGNRQEQAACRTGCKSTHDSDKQPVAPERSNTNAGKRDFQGFPAFGTLRLFSRILGDCQQYLPAALTVEFHAPDYEGKGASSQ